MGNREDNGEGLSDAAKAGLAFCGLVVGLVAIAVLWERLFTEEVLSEMRARDAAKEAAGAQYR